MNDISLIIVYHYVRRPEEKPAMKGLLVDGFERQIAFLREHNYKIVTLGELLELHEKGLSASGKYAALTFDDGLKDHYTNVLPILRRYGLGGTFFIITKSLTEGWMAPAHQIHFILAAAPVAEIRGELDTWLTGQSSRGDIDRKKIDGRAGNFYPWDDPSTASLKYLLNKEFDENLRRAAVRHLFSTFVGDIREKAASFYLSLHDLEMMRSFGAEIGSHSHTHPWLASLSEEEQKRELVLSKEILEGALGKEIGLFSYPYGTRDSFSDATLRFLKNHGYRAAVTTDEHHAFYAQDPFLLSRVDTNEVHRFV